MHRCLNCGEELTFDWGDDPKRCDPCLRRYYRFETWDIKRRGQVERAQYHQRRREEEEKNAITRALPEVEVPNDD